MIEGHRLVAAAVRQPGGALLQVREQAGEHARGLDGRKLGARPRSHEHEPAFRAQRVAFHVLYDDVSVQVGRHGHICILPCTQNRAPWYRTPNPAPRTQHPEPSTLSSSEKMTK